MSGPRLAEHALMLNTTSPSALHIGDLTAALDLYSMAAEMAASDPWLTLGRSAQQCLALLNDSSKERYAAFQGDACAGLLILNFHGAFVGYLQTIFVAPPYRDCGVGTALVEFAESRIFRDHPNVFLCVSAFNAGARRLYARLGYQVVGEITDFLAPGHSEMLLRKTRGAIGSYVAGPRT
jgi:[ribosomal protein S18]-alanine N-acetyltransferase